MIGLLDLWLPILVASVAVFILSFIAWMFMPHHKPDFKKLPDEDAFLGVVRAQKLEPAVYMYPYCADPNQMKDPEYKKKYEAGPHGTLMTWPCPPSMGRNLAVVFLFYLVLSFFVAYLASLTLDGQSSFAHVFRITGTAALLGYAFGAIPGGIFFGRTFRSMLMDVIDNVVYGLATGLIFAWLWPAAEAATAA